MKNKWFGVIFIIVGLLLTKVALSETVAEYTAVMPSISYINTGNDDARSLNSSLYISEDEIWYSGYATPSGSWLIHTNSKGEIASRTLFPDAPGKDPIIHCIGKVENTLMIGFIDAETQAGTIGLMPCAGGKISYIMLQNNEKTMTMTRTSNGIFSLGVVYDQKQNTSTLFASHVVSTGQFDLQQAVYTTDMTVDGFVLSSSKGCVADDKYYVQVNSGIAGRVRPQRELFCLDKDGFTQWKIMLPENAVFDQLAASDGNVYLFGMTGNVDDDIILSNRRATIVCYRDNGTKSWEKVFDSPERFYFGTSCNDACIAASGIEGTGTWNACSLTADGNVRYMVSVEFVNDMHIRGVFETTDGYLKVLGTTESQLFMFQIKN
ncbi:MAG: hypothetical protein RSI33_00370 [Clostridia bacterium]